MAQSKLPEPATEMAIDISNSADSVNPLSVGKVSEGDVHTPAMLLPNLILNKENLQNQNYETHDELLINCNSPQPATEMADNIDDKNPLPAANSKTDPPNLLRYEVLSGYIKEGYWRDHLHMLMQTEAKLLKPRLSGEEIL